MADEKAAKGLRILTADEDESTLQATDKILGALGHTVTGHATTSPRSATSSPARTPTSRSSSSHDDDEHALDLIEEMGEYARGPIIALVGSHEPGFVSRAPPSAGSTPSRGRASSTRSRARSSSRCAATPRPRG